MDQLVVTHGYTDGTTIDACDRHEDMVSNFSETGASYAGVSHGQHAGSCDFCRDEQEVAS